MRVYPYLRSRSRMLLLCGTVLLAGFCSPAGARTQQMPARLSPALQSAIVDSVAAALLRTYIFLETAEEMADLIRTRAAEGAYAGHAAPLDFVGQLTADLQSVSHDLHLRISVRQPSNVAAERLSPEEQIRQRNESLRRENYRFQKVEILPGNIGYLKFNNFIEAELAGPTAVAAMNFLANVDALIIDLRDNGGGSPSMIQLLSSYFFAEPVHLNSFYIRQTDEWEQYWTYAHVSGPRLTDTPLFILTSSRTFSAAEEFTYNLKNLERATIIGETTRGGAHPVTGVTFQFEGIAIGVSRPYGRAVNPITGMNWEGTGIEPHIAVPADRALDRALEEISRGGRER